MFTANKVAEKRKNRPVGILDAFLVKHFDGSLVRIENDDVLAENLEVNDVPCRWP